MNVLVFLLDFLEELAFVRPSIIVAAVKPPARPTARTERRLRSSIKALGLEVRSLKTAGAWRERE